MIPEDLRYSSDHEWVRTTGDEADAVTVRIGITDYAQNSLGDIVFVQVPEPGTTVEPGESIGEVESTKSVSDLFSPVSGTVVARNEVLDSTPDLQRFALPQNLGAAAASQRGFDEVRTSWVARQDADDIAGRSSTVILMAR